MMEVFYKLRQWALEQILRRAHRLCDHSGRCVADLNEGDCCDREISWCQTCGAVYRCGVWDLAVDPWKRGRTSDDRPGVAPAHERLEGCQ